MERSHARSLPLYRTVALALVALTLVSSSGCLHLLLATGIYLWEGGNLVDAECNELEGHRVVVVCRPPSSHEYRHAGAASNIAGRVSSQLAQHVKGIDVVNPKEVDNWLDESDWGEFEELARAVHADRVVHVELHDFDLFKGKTLYQGNADVTVSVYDMKDHGRLLWDTHLGEVLYPVNSGIPAQDKPMQQFQREFVEIVAERVAISFYPHDPNGDFAMDALANR